MGLTKNDMSRVIVQALYDLDSLPDADQKHVVSMTRRNKKSDLEENHATTIRILREKESSEVDLTLIEVTELD